MLVLFDRYKDGRIEVLGRTQLKCPHTSLRDALAGLKIVARIAGKSMYASQSKCDDWVEYSSS